MHPKRTPLRHFSICTEPGKDKEAPIPSNPTSAKKSDALGKPQCVTLINQSSQKGRGPMPMQLVVVRAVRKAVSAATITFATSSTIRFLSMILDF